MSESGPIESVAALFPGGVAITPGAGDAAPRWKGAYVLLLRLDEPVSVIHRKARGRFAPGWYAYCGSANGPGGVGARLSRHFRKDKRLHWHVDGLTIRAAEMTALAFEGASECDLVARLAETGRFAAKVTGFGSSDCRTCTAHLLQWDADQPPVRK